MPSFSHGEFYHRAPGAVYLRSLDQLLIECFSSKASIAFEFSSDDQANIICDDSGRDSILLEVSCPHNLSIATDTLPDDFAHNIFLPYLMIIRKVIFPHNFIFSCGYKDKSIADFFVRNLINNIIVKSKITIDLNPDNKTYQSNDMLSYFMESYYRFIKEFYKRDIETNNILNHHLKANCIFPYLEFTSARLRKDSHRIGQLKLKYSDDRLDK